MTNDKDTNGKLLSEEEVDALEDAYVRGFDDDEIMGEHGVIVDLLADRKERIERNAKGIEIMFAKMNKLDTPKRGELHLLLISLFS